MKAEELKKEINANLDDMIELNLKRNYISAGTFIRFRDKCILLGQLAGEKKATERCLKIIEELGEVRNKDNTLSFITFGDNFSTNSIKLLKQELNQKIKEGEGTK